MLLAPSIGILRNYIKEKTCQNRKGEPVDKLIHLVVVLYNGTTVAIYWDSQEVHKGHTYQRRKGMTVRKRRSIHQEIDQYYEITVTTYWNPKELHKGHTYQRRKNDCQIVWFQFRHSELVQYYDITAPTYWDLQELHKGHTI